MPPDSQAFSLMHKIEHLTADLASCGVPLHVYEKAVGLVADARTLANTLKSAPKPAEPKTK